MSGKILVVDDQSLSRIILRARLSSACYEPILAPSGQAALDLARTHIPDLVLMDCCLPDMNGPAVCAALRADPMTAHIPIILFSADAGREMRLQAFASGADDFLIKPLDEGYLLSRLRALLRMTAQGQEHRKHMTPALRIGLAGATDNTSATGRVALVCSGQSLADAGASTAQGLFHSTLELPDVLNPAPATTPPDVLLLAPEILAQHGEHIISELRSRPLTRHIPIIVLLPTDLHHKRAMVLDLGAEDVLCLPLDPVEARMRLDMVITRKKWADAMRHAVDAELDLASRDQMTGLFNRRHAISRLTELIANADSAQAEGFALLLIDLDNFKRVNDTLGHLAGDDVLRQVAQRMRAVLRPDDLLARYGGEEFLLVLPGMTATAAHQMAERIRSQIEGTDYVVKQGAARLQMTASVGITVQALSAPTCTRPTATRIEELIDSADQALHLAKSSGRNRVSLGFCAVA